MEQSQVPMDIRVVVERDSTAMEEGQDKTDSIAMEEGHGDNTVHIEQDSGQSKSPLDFYQQSLGGTSRETGAFSMNAKPSGVLFGGSRPTGIQFGGHKPAGGWRFEDCSPYTGSEETEKIPPPWGFYKEDVWNGSNPAENAERKLPRDVTSIYKFKDLAVVRRIWAYLPSGYKYEVWKSGYLKTTFHSTHMAADRAYLEYINKAQPASGQLVMFPSFLYCQDRLVTFANWPKSRMIKAEELARAGFVFGGRDSLHYDATQCFYCGIIVHSWNDKDTGWGEHKRHSPHCPYIHMCLNDNDPTGKITYLP